MYVHSINFVLCNFQYAMQIFNEIDTDGNGYITPDEVVAGYKKLGVEITLENAKAIVDESDTDKDGRISYDGECISLSTMS